MKPTPAEIVERASPRPWTYHNNGRTDWVEDARGTVILENVGYLDGPLLVAVVNDAHHCGVEEDALNEAPHRQIAD